MQEINLLFINMPSNLVSTSLAILRRSNIKLAYDSVEGEKEIEQALSRGSCWDVLLVTEKNSDERFPALEKVIAHTKKTPIVFIRNEPCDATYITVMKKGASDCMSKNQLERLPLIIEREVKHKRRSDLLTNTVHEMRNSLNSIILSSKLLLKQRNDNLKKKQIKFANAIHHSGNHLLQYINHFLAPADIGSPKKNLDLSHTDIQPFCQNILQVFSPIAKENKIHFEFNIRGRVPANIKTNAIYLERILSNLLSNAFKYTNEGKVTLSIYSAAGRELAETDDNHQSCLAFEIRDTGIGIPEDELNYIFNRHYRSNQKDSQECQGSGLGLDICQQLTASLGGTLKVESQVGVGSTFTLFMPSRTSLLSKTEPKTMTKSKSKPEREKTIPSEKTILVVDDNTLHNMAIKEFLEYEFNQCFTTNSAKEAYNILETEHVDCLILDLTLPDTNGLQLARYLKKEPNYFEIPILVYTGKNLNEEEQNTLSKYVDAIVQKETYSYHALIHTIYSLVNAKPFAAESLKQLTAI